jgi:hypothetical protein
VWWKLFGNEEQYYTSVYQNRIAEIAQHIEVIERGSKVATTKKEKEKNSTEDKDEEKSLTPEELIKDKILNLGKKQEGKPPSMKDQAHFVAQ